MAGDDRVEQVVREVLRVLSAQGLGAPVGTPAPDVASSQPAGTNDLVLATRVVSLAELEGRLSGVRRIVVDARAVLTPAARDRLKESNIAIQRVAVGKTGRVNGHSVLVATAETSRDAAPIVSLLTRCGFQVEQLARSGLASVVEEIAVEAAKGGRRGIVLTDEPDAAAWLANRMNGVRAIAASGLVRLRKSLASLAPNLLVLDAAGNWHESPTMAREFCESIAERPQIAVR